MKDVFLMIGRDVTDEVHFDLIEDEGVFNAIIADPDQEKIVEALYQARDEGFVVFRGFTQTRCEETFLEGYNIKKLHCYLVF